MKKYFIFYLFTSFLIMQNNQIKAESNVKPDRIRIVDEEDKLIKDPELREALVKLRQEFNDQNELIKANYLEKIKPIKVKKDNAVTKLKNDYLEKRKNIFKKFGYKKQIYDKTPKPLNKIKSDNIEHQYKVQPKIKKIDPIKDKKNNQ